MAMEIDRAKPVNSPIPLVFVPYECNKNIISRLPRSALKSLRLTCKGMNDIVLSPISHLFNRAYISTNSDDLEALENIANNPRMAQLVRELVWDMTSIRRKKRTATNKDGERVVVDEKFPEERNSFLQRFNDPVMARRILRQMRAQYDDNEKRGRDLQLLVNALPKLTNCEKVTMTKLFPAWNETWLKHPWQLRYESPAMRNTAHLGFSIPSCMESAPEDIRDYLDWAVVELPGILRQYHGQARELELERYMSTMLWGAQYRALVLLIAALRYTNVQLREFSIESAHRLSSIEQKGRTDVLNRTFAGFDLLFFRERDVKENFPGLFSAFRRISLSIESDFAMFDAWNERTGSKTKVTCRDLMGILDSTAKLAANLESLELRLSGNARRAFFYPLLKLPSLSNIQELTLRNFHITNWYLKIRLLPWCFSNEVKVLRLASCSFMGVCIKNREKNCMGLFEWLFEQEVRQKDDMTWENNGKGIREANDDNRKAADVGSEMEIESNGCSSSLDDEMHESDVKNINKAFSNLKHADVKYDICEYNGGYGTDQFDEIDLNSDAIHEIEEGWTGRLTGLQARVSLSKHSDIGRVIRRGIELFIDGKHYRKENRVIRVLIDDYPVIV